MKRILIDLLICFSFLIPFASANAENLFICIDPEGNKMITSSPQDGMNDCVLKDSYSDDSPKERAQQQKKSQKGAQRYQRESEEAEKETAAREQEEAALIREGNKCYTQTMNVISGGRVSDVYYWRICKDKNGKTISERRLNYPVK
jgi:hypothetical protein